MEGKIYLLSHNENESSHILEKVGQHFLREKRHIFFHF